MMNEFGAVLTMLGLLALAIYVGLIFTLPPPHREVLLAPLRPIYNSWLDWRAGRKRK